MHVVNDSVQVLDNATPTTSYPPPRKKLRTRSSGVVGQSSYLPQGTNFAMEVLYFIVRLTFFFSCIG